MRSLGENMIRSGECCIVDSDTATADSPKAGFTERGNHGSILPYMPWGIHNFSGNSGAEDMTAAVAAAGRLEKRPGRRHVRRRSGRDHQSQHAEIASVVFPCVVATDVDLLDVGRQFPQRSVRMSFDPRSMRGLEPLDE